MIGRRIIIGLVVAVVVTPMLTCLLLGIGFLLAAMQDPAGAVVLQRLALASGIFWLIELVLLLVSLALAYVLRP